MSKSTKAAALAQYIHAGRRATFTGIVYTKVGKLRGKGADRKRFGDATVSEVIVTGFNYLGLVARSIKAAGEAGSVARLLFTTNVIQRVINVDGAGIKLNGVTFDQVEAWIEEQVQSWRDTLAGEQPPEDHYEAVEVDGQIVKGAKKYVGEGTGVKGGIYLAGLLISSKTLKEPANGYAPAPNSAIKTIVKNATRKLTPVGRYVTRRLTPGNVHTLRIGGNAAVYVDSIGQEITDDSIAFLKSLED